MKGILFIAIFNLAVAKSSEKVFQCLEKSHLIHKILITTLNKNFISQVGDYRCGSLYIFPHFKENSFHQIESFNFFFKKNITHQDLSKTGEWIIDKTDYYQYQLRLGLESSFLLDSEIKYQDNASYYERIRTSLEYLFKHKKLSFFVDSFYEKIENVGYFKLINKKQIDTLFSNQTFLSCVAQNYQKRIQDLNISPDDKNLNKKTTLDIISFSEFDTKYVKQCMKTFIADHKEIIENQHRQTITYFFTTFLRDFFEFHPAYSVYQSEEKLNFVLAGANTSFKHPRPLFQIYFDIPKLYHRGNIRELKINEFKCDDRKLPVKNSYRFNQIMLHPLRQISPKSNHGYKELSTYLYQLKTTLMRSSAQHLQKNSKLILAWKKACGDYIPSSSTLGDDD